MIEAFICDAVRTPFGRYGGALSGIRTDDLAAIPLKALLELREARLCLVDLLACGLHLRVSQPDFVASLNEEFRWEHSVVDHVGLRRLLRPKCLGG